MPLMYTFCTWFSVRLGSVIIAIISLVQMIILLGFSIFGLRSTEEISSVTKKLLRQYDMMFYTSHFFILQHYTKEVFVTLIIFFAVHSITCLLLIHGAIRNNISEIVPFAILEFIRINVYVYTHIAVLILVKTHVLDFNVLIACIIAGGFILFFLYYAWLCPVSLIQCLLIVTSRSKSSQMDFKMRKDMTVNRPHPDSTGLVVYDYLSADFRPNPKRYPYPYQYYSNLPKLVF